MQDISTNMSEITSKISYTASIGAIASGLSFNEWMAVSGAGFAAATFLVNWYFQYKNYKLKKARYGEGS